MPLLSYFCRTTLDELQRRSLGEFPLLDSTYSTCYNLRVRRADMKDKDLLRLLKQSGWTVVRINGSHHVLQKGEQTTVVPIHGRDVPAGLLNQILKEAGLK